MMIPVVGSRRGNSWYSTEAERNTRNAAPRYSDTRISSAASAIAQGFRVSTRATAAIGVASSASPASPDSRLPSERPSLRAMVSPLATRKTPRAITPSPVMIAPASAIRSPKGNVASALRTTRLIEACKAIRSSSPLRTRRRSRRKAQMNTAHQNPAASTAVSILSPSELSWVQSAASWGTGHHRAG